MNHREVDICVLLSAISMLFSLFGTLAYSDEVVEEVIEPVVETDTRSIYEIVGIDNERNRYINETKPPYDNPEEFQILFEEEAGEGFNCLFYATESIGRYYITAYNHKETGSKMTASGSICHEGTVTTCAADVWGGYFKFGDYIEVGNRLYRVEDTGSAVKKKHIDLYFASYSDMARYGSNYQTIYRVSFPFGKPADP